jgi:xanthine dehydrogenase YagR molybdenum-binding subunit
MFVNYPDTVFDELGACGAAEIGPAGMATAVTRAVHHARGAPVRELPVKIED